MVAKPESPDFDSMSQDELQAFLAQLERAREETPPQPADTGAKNGDRSDWLDDTQRTLTTQPPDAADGDDEDDDTPADLLLDAADFAPPPDALDWLREIAAADMPEELPDITDYQVPEASLSLDDILRASPEDDALVWLDKLTAEFNSSPRDSRHDITLPTDFGDDFGEDFEDDASLDDQEDESLYSPRGTVSGALAQPGWDDREAADQSRQADRLANAFVMPGEAADLEAWYAERLAALEGRGTSPPAAAPQPTSEPAPAPETLPELQAAAKLPPPGLAAAINSARAKVAAEALGEALIVYESLLGTPAGLDWVEMDMRALLDQPAHEDDPLLHRMLGDALMRSGQLDAALAAYRQALALV